MMHGPCYMKKNNMGERFRMWEGESGLFEGVFLVLYNIKFSTLKCFKSESDSKLLFFIYDVPSK